MITGYCIITALIFILIFRQTYAEDEGDETARIARNGALSAIVAPLWPVIIPGAAVIAAIVLFVFPLIKHTILRGIK